MRTFQHRADLGDKDDQIIEKQYAQASVFIAAIDALIEAVK